MKTLLVARSALKRMQEAFSFWEAKQTVIKGAIKYPQVFSIEIKRKKGKPLGLLLHYTLFSDIMIMPHKWSYALFILIRKRS